MNHIDPFIQTVNTVIQSPESADQKIDQIVALIDQNTELLGSQKNPAKRIEIEQIAANISTLPVTLEKEAAKIASAAQLITHAESFCFPPEIMNLIVTRLVQSTPPEEAAAMRMTSKETRKQAAEAFRGPLTQLKIKTADEVIQFAQEFGPVESVNPFRVPLTEPIIMSTMTTEEVIQFAQDFGLPGLTYLNIEGIEFSNENLEKLMQYVPNLTTLLAGNCKIGPSGAIKLASSMNLKKLHTLDLSENKIDNLGVSIIARSENLRNLQTLVLLSADIDEVGAIEIAKFLPKLQALDLSFNNIKDSGVRAIANSETLQTLHSLKIVCCDFGDEGITAIVNSKMLKNLGVLHLGLLHNFDHCDAVAQAIASSETLKNLQELNVNASSIGDEGAIAIATSQILKNLQALTLSHSDVGDRGVRAIATSPTLGNLHTLNLQMSNVGMDGVMAIVTSQTLKNLHTLLLSELSNEENMILIHSQLFKKLQKLELKGWTPLGDVVKFALSKRSTLSHLSEEQWNKLYQNICQIANVDFDEAWAKANLFQDQARFETAFAML